MMLLRMLMTILLALQAGLGSAQDFVPVPPLKARVTDQIGMLTAQQRATLESVLASYEEKSGSQIAILLMSSTAPESIEQYSIRVADAWKLGRKGVDDGVLLIVARDNPPALRRLRIEAFRGVQGSLTDVRAKRILDDVIAPHFRQNDFYGGLTAAVSAIIGLLEAEQLPGPDAQAADQEDDGLGMLFIAGLFFAMVILSHRRNRRYRHRHGWGRTVPGVILGGGIGHSYGGGFGGGFGGGGFGGGGFSGGGGGADGGGASGNW